jgi:hypothetical protein
VESQDLSQELVNWLGKRTSLCVVSPHFDDAIYSAFVALTLPVLSRRAVATVITTAPEGKVTAWATLTGFANTYEEHLVRAREDVAVLDAIGVEPMHLGGVSESTASLPAAVDRFASLFLGAAHDWAFLLPAGAGIQVGRLERLLRRMLRRPVRQMAHPEHLGSRDRLRQRLQATPGAAWGYYAENPYVTFDNAAALGRRLQRREQQPLRCVRCSPDATAKLRSAEGYASQANLGMGSSHAERIAFASRPEVYFLGEAGC